MNRYASIAASALVMLAGCGHSHVELGHSHVELRVMSLPDRTREMTEWACRYELQVVAHDLDPDWTDTIDPPSFSRGTHLVVPSGERIYEVWPVPADRDASGAHRWEVRRAGAPPITFGSDVATRSLPGVRSDQSGALLLRWEERTDGHTTDRRALIDGDTVLPIELPPGVWSDVRVDRVDDGWILLTENDCRGMVAFAISPSGSVELRFMALPYTLVAAGHGALGAIARVEGRPGVLAFASSALGPVRVDIEDVEHHGGNENVLAFVSSDDGWWVVTVVDWYDVHNIDAPTEFRVIHLDSRGRVLGRVHHPLADYAPPRIEGLRVAGTSLHIRYSQRDAAYSQIEVAPRGACRVDVPGPCEARRWRRAEFADRLLESRARTEWQSAALPTYRGCVATRGSRTVFAIADDQGLSVFEGERMIWQAEGAWMGCQLAMLEDRLVVVGGELDGGVQIPPVPTPVVHVLSYDGSLIARHESGRQGHVDDVLVDADGVWITTNLLWGVMAWRLDLGGRPIGTPRFLTELHYRPTTGLVHTQLGPTLLWSDSVEEGALPLCTLAEEPAGNTSASR